MTQDELLHLIDQAAAEGWTELDLAGHHLTELPPEMGQLTQLEVLILGKLADEYEWVGNQRLPKVIGNQLTTLPAELGQLRNLRR
ncbi:MAG TPA: hypothetical protein IGR64_03900, partial [Leptolyngbyaceae cyanobacterium M65_K2018_010]|nr:hypothetical protein [Leptolyngbyaceae cyanobacterium M65_K2018_010]